MKIRRDAWALTSGALVLLWAASALARPHNNGGASAGGCAACGVMLIIVPLVLLVLDIALLVWVARDAKARGMDSSVLWMFLVMFTSLIGLVIYIFARPQGNLVVCPHCQGKRLEASVKCPHCGNAGSGGYGPPPAGGGYGPPPGGGGYGPPPGGGGYGPPPGGGGYGPPPGGGGYGPPPGGGGYGPPPGGYGSSPSNV
jgi:Phospholipase_D-nuclease N-terminal